MYAENDIVRAYQIISDVPGTVSPYNLSPFVNVIFVVIRGMNPGLNCAYIACPKFAQLVPWPLLTVLLNKARKYIVVGSVAKALRLIAEIITKLHRLSPIYVFS